MKTIKNIVRQLCRPAALIALGLALCASASQAATLRMETKVPGYTGRGNGWVLVLPELRSLLGGKVHWDNARGCYITDRVARGETMRISILPSTPTEKCLNIAVEGIAPGNRFYFDKLVLLPYVVNDFKVSTSPSYDNVRINCATLSGTYSWRIPIGSR